MKEMTKKNAAHVLGTLNAMIQGQDRDTSKTVLDAMNQALDGLLEQEMFGTEGQNDPRGDQR